MWTISSQAAYFLYTHNNMSSSSTSSLSHTGTLDSQQFHCIFPAALPRWQQNILYALVLQQPFLVLELEQQSLYKEDESIQSLVHVFHHLCATQTYLGTLEPCTNHILPSTLNIMSAIDDTLDLLHDHGLHYHILSLPPWNITLACTFWPIYWMRTAVERDTYEELDLRLVNHLTSLPFILPVLTPHSPTPTEPLNVTPGPSPQSTTATLLDDPTDPHPAFHQGWTTSYPTWVAPRDPRLGPQPITTATTVCFHCHD